MLHHAGLDLNTAENMPMHYALAFLSEKAAIGQTIKAKFEYERQNNSHAKVPVQASSGKSYRSTKRVCS